MIYQKETEVNTMTIDSTFWVAISFFIFFGVLIYFKVPQKINEILNKLILDINSGKIEIFDDKLDQERVKGVLVDQSNKGEQ